MNCDQCAVLKLQFDHTCFQADEASTNYGDKEKQTNKQILR